MKMKILQWGFASLIVFLTSAFLASGQAPYIIDQPTNETVAAGGIATFNVTAGGSTPLSYQWYFNETNLVGTNATLTINDVTSANTGPYYVMVENAYGSTNSHAADLRVTSSGQSQAPYIIAQPTNVTAAAGNTATFSVTAGGAAPLSYQWYFNGTNLAAGTNATLVITNTTSADAGPYYVMVENAYGSTNSIAAVLTVNSSGSPQAPYIIDQPTNETVTAGGTATFSVTAGGTAPLSYQWYSNGTNIQFATNATLILPDVTPANAGPYYVMVDNAYGTTNSATAILAINGSTSCDPAPSGIVSWWPGESNADDIIGNNNGILEGSIGFGPGEVGEAFLYTTTNDAVRIPASASLDVGTNGAFTVEGWINPSDVSQLHCIFEWNNGSSFGVHFYISADPAPGTLYANVVDSDGNWHQMSSSVSPVTANVFQHVALTYDQASGTATMYYNGAIVGQQNLGSYTPQTSYDLYLGRRPPGIDSTWTFSGLIDEPSIYNRALSASEVAAIYQAGSEGKCPPSPPPSGAAYIITQPANQTVPAGGTATFSVVAGGTAPLSYQWYFDETNLVGTNATLVITNATYSDAGPYFVTVENAYGSTNSATAILTVNSSGPSQAPYIIDQPTNQTVAAGGTATFSVVAGGAAPLSYQWYFGETNLVGTNATLTINDVTAGDVGPYSVIVENAYGST
ncbi:MAG TPA: immunoglobulin domain-containing protein, partial [Alphaproteobacteria bacterium]|nr:immunoglobulin domain-containing protein [Alphaproteobacteria bacterium]